MLCDVYDLLWAIYTNGWVLSQRVAMSILVFVLMISPHDGAGIDGFSGSAPGGLGLWCACVSYFVVDFLNERGGHLPCQLLDLSKWLIYNSQPQSQAMHSAMLYKQRFLDQEELLGFRLPMFQPQRRRIFTTLGVTAAVKGTRRKMKLL